MGREDSSPMAGRLSKSPQGGAPSFEMGLFGAEQHPTHEAKSAPSQLPLVLLEANRLPKRPLVEKPRIPLQHGDFRKLRPTNEGREGGDQDGTEERQSAVQLRGERGRETSRPEGH